MFLWTNTWWSKILLDLSNTYMLFETSLLYLENKLLRPSKMYVRLRDWGSLAGRSVVFRFSCPLAAVPALVFKENIQKSSLLSHCEIRQNSATRSHFEKVRNKSFYFYLIFWILWDFCRHFIGVRNAVFKISSGRRISWNVC